MAAAGGRGRLVAGAVSGEAWTTVGWNALAAVLVLVVVWIRLNRERR